MARMLQFGWVLAALTSLDVYKAALKSPEKVNSLELDNLKELDLRENGGVELPDSLGAIPGLHLNMGNNRLTRADQTKLRRRFPKATFSFENEYDDAIVNEEPPQPDGGRP